MKYEIKFEENASTEDILIIGAGIGEFCDSKFPRGNKKLLTFFVRDEKGSIVGGVHGNYNDYEWLYVQMLWVSKVVRTRGYGTKLMNHIEQKACEAGCRAVYLDTFSFQAPDFYKKLGYTVFGELKDFPTGHSRIFLRKQLVEKTD